MKKLLLTGILACGFATAGFSQGAVTFKNFGTGANGSIAFGSANVTDASGANLDGAGFTAELINTADGSSLGTVNFGSGALAGTFNPTPTLIVAGVANGASANLQVRAWDNSSGADFDNALVRGESNAFDVTLGDPTVPSSLPILVGMNSFSLAVVPEPSVILLGLAGAGLLWFRRKK